MDSPDWQNHLARTEIWSRIPFEDATLHIRSFARASSASAVPCIFSGVASILLSHASRVARHRSIQAAANLGAWDRRALDGSAPLAINHIFNYTGSATWKEEMMSREQMDGDGVCQHIEGIHEVRQAKHHECEECVKMGSSWVHLRTCQSCGVTLCCDSSPNRHASRHASDSGHPVICSAESGERWLYCYRDDALAEY
jgi:Zn-finger in ubiquitin-hydrolases and other protein